MLDIAPDDPDYDTDKQDAPDGAMPVGASGRPWALRDYCTDEAASIARNFDLPPALAAALVARGINGDGVEAFLTPRLKTSMPDPYALRDMDVAARLTADAVQGNSKIGIFGDFDVDGASSSALLHRYFEAVGIDHEVYIPDRLSEGYGPNIPAMTGLVEQGCELIITVDCGIAAHEPIAAVADLGAATIVLDHHRPDETLPTADAVVNPNRRDDDSGVGYLAGVGVAYLFLIALNRVLREDGFFEGREEPPLLEWLDLVALGTVCDVVPLKGLNRALVAQGLRLLAAPTTAGLSALHSMGKIDGAVSTDHLGFQFGPRLNAAGRMGQSRLAFELLSAPSHEEAASIATTLDLLNKQRQGVEQDVLKAARAALKDSADDLPILLAYGEGWHGGVLGIAAGRLKERFGRPCLIGHVEDGLVKGSGRSVPGINLGEAMHQALAKGLAVTGGGHAMAAGFGVPLDKIDAFHKHMCDFALQAMDGEPISDPLVLDSWVAAGAVNPGLADRLARLAPFGSGNPEPVFGVRGVELTQADIVGRNHVRCRFVSNGSWVQGIAFKCAEEPMGQALLSGIGKRFDLAGTIRLNEWNGRVKVDFVLSDVASYR
ncbi:MAG: single-stranded-DNA-specific exonuclease RecJ [Alphaproteobacteria bacterium]|nr:single-stranded-DNA-specific exonuclease RecJ [Alphaproteobacteria bacterium]MAS46175.1 single-stranded-DNA-specific exonuclease RecJ [Alphaproteobacteria bacterium]MAX95642.1 single-stranded-DNA-specific exonuclease RecJ [Alphaproteobacteria bacterium]MBN54222.1 single-stranded-DNA-specific exonuclease RecJ [Alphaproteobacteria bacterium]OUT42204.1 MAG: single-stranded-DNA-specific exonuclease RecJ [Micavibrio sp. TMED2]|tara:strand:+ start:8005 stop:9813 length:1809 start_codon:yes stop_codon:yes gene_type:complete